MPCFISSVKPAEKQESEVKKEIQGVLRQITASVSFLPLLDDPCEVLERDLFCVKSQSKNKRSSAQGNYSAKSRVAYVTSYNYNYDSELACWALGALPNIDTILLGGGGQSPWGTVCAWGTKSTGVGGG